VKAHGGERAILVHPFFNDKIDWEALEECKVKPPFKPKIVRYVLYWWHFLSVCVCGVDKSFKHASAHKAVYKDGSLCNEKSI